MMHQIRKMVGLAVAVLRGVAPRDCIKQGYDTFRYLNIPMAPELGLFLDRTFYESYNRKWAPEHDVLNSDEWAETIAEFKVSMVEVAVRVWVGFYQGSTTAEHDR